MKAITIRQPFASLIVCGLKEYEFRTWKTAYRGDLLIHAGKEADRAAMKKFEAYDLEYPLGRVIGKAVLSDCVRVDERLRQELREKNAPVYSGTTENPQWQGYGFRLERAEPVKPVEAKGKLGLWECDWPHKILAACGNDCSACPRHLPKTEAELRATAELWKEIGYRSQVVSNREIACTGCKSTNWCRYQIVGCACAHGVPHCGKCREYPCSKLQDCFQATGDFLPACEKACSPEELACLRKAFFEKRENLDAAARSPSPLKLR